MKVNIPEWEYDQLVEQSLNTYSRHQCMLRLETMAWNLSRRCQSPRVKRQIAAARNRIALLKLLTTDES